MAPEKVEGVYARSPFVAQSFVYGNSLRAQLVAVVVPDPDHLLPWAAARKLPGDLKALCANKVVADAVLRSMQEEGRGRQAQLLRAGGLVTAVWCWGCGVGWRMVLVLHGDTVLVGWPSAHCAEAGEVCIF